MENLNTPLNRSFAVVVFGWPCFFVFSLVPFALLKKYIDISFTTASGITLVCLGIIHFFYFYKLNKSYKYTDKKNYIFGKAYILLFIPTEYLGFIPVISGIFVFAKYL